MTDEAKREAFRLIYSLEYRVEDVNTSTGNVLSVILPHLVELAEVNPLAAEAMASKLLEAIQEKPLADEHLRECFPAYCELIGVEWVEG